MDVETAVNRGHNEPGRLTRCGSLAKAQCYLEMLDRVWMTDARFRAEHPRALERAESAAVVAVAARALLNSKPDVARRALTRWRQIDGRTKTHKALACVMLSRVPGGRSMLRAAMLAEKLLKRATSSSHGSSAVNPGA